MKTMTMILWMMKKEIEWEEDGAEEDDKEDGVEWKKRTEIEKKKKIETSKPLEFELNNIAVELRQIQTLMKCLKVSSVAL